MYTTYYENENNETPRSRAIPSLIPFVSAGYLGKLRKDYLKTKVFKLSYKDLRQRPQGIEFNLVFFGSIALLLLSVLIPKLFSFESVFFVSAAQGLAVIAFLSATIRIILDFKQGEVYIQPYRVYKYNSPYIFYAGFFINIFLACFIAFFVIKHLFEK